MSKILPQYSYNVPKGKTHWKGKKYTGGQYGMCPRECDKCVAFGNQCKGCDIINCIDKYCKGKQCDKCVVICNRAEKRIKQSIEFLSGLDVSYTKTNDSPISYKNWYIPAINKPNKNLIKAECFSVPFYSVYDFQAGKIITSDIRDYFKIEGDIIMNFYMKDDKICYLYDVMMEGNFIKLMKEYKDVSHFHTPCFSVFRKSNNMDVIHNWKRQWWIGDIMRDAGLSTIQEVLTTNEMKKVNASWESAIELIHKKGIKKISQCGQLDSSDASMDGVDFLRALPRDCTYQSVGMRQKVFDAYRQFKKNMYLSNYDLSYKHKDSKTYLNQKKGG